MLEVYDNSYSSCSTKVRIVLNEKGIVWKRIPIDLTMFDQKTPEYLAINASGVVPAIVTEDGKPLAESHIIIQFLDAQYGGASLSPEAPSDRARMQMFLKAADEFHLSQGLLNYDQLFLPYWRRLPPAELDRRLARFADPTAANRLRFLLKNGLDADRVRGALSATDRFFCSLEERLETNKWVLGNDYSLADAAVTPYVNSALHVITDFWFGKKRNIARWLRQVRERPSYRAAVLDHPNRPDLQKAIEEAPDGGGFREI